MHPDGRVKCRRILWRSRFGDLDGTIQRARTSAAANQQNGVDAGFGGAAQDLVAIVGESAAIKMTVGVNEHSRFLVSMFHVENTLANMKRETLQRETYFSFDPTGRSSRNPASTGLP